MANEKTSKVIFENSNKRWYERRWFWMVLAVVVSSGYVFVHLQTGWVPWDEGQLAQSAERVLNGEVPHRDFDEMYTGGLTYLNAAAFKMFGVCCESTRWMLWLFFMPFCCSIFWLAARACPAWAAALVTFAASAISLPVYTAALPSWYNLFFLTFGIVASIKFIESEKKYWLFVAGLCAGVSVLFKVTGLFWLAAAMLFVVYFEQTKPSSQQSRSIGFDLFVVGCLALFAMVGLKFCGIIDSGIGDGLNFAHLCLPMIAVSLFLSAGQIRSTRGSFAFRFLRLLNLQIPVLAGALIPVAAWIGFYLSLGALDSLYEGVFILPLARLASASHAFPGWMHLLAAVPFVVLIVAGFVDRGFLKNRNSWLTFVGVAMVAAAWIAAYWDVFYWQMLFHAFRNCLPMIVVAALGYLYVARSQLDRQRRLELFLLTAAAVTGGLIQFPFSIDIYYFYIAPVVLLVIVYLVQTQVQWSKAVQVAWLAGFAILAVFKMSTVYPANNTIGITNPNGTKKLRLTRCSMVVPDFDAVVYEELVEKIHQLSGPQDAIFAGPDCPEVYFLSGRRNPTRIIYDFFRPEIVSQPERFIEQLRQSDVRLIVFRREVAFSDLNRELESEAKRFFAKRYDIYRRDPCDPNRQQLAFTILYNED